MLLQAVAVRSISALLTGVLLAVGSKILGVPFPDSVSRLTGGANTAGYPRSRGANRAGADDDWPRLGAVLRRPGAQEECAGHDDTKLRDDGAYHRALGHRRVQPLFRVGERFHRWD